MEGTNIYHSPSYVKDRNLKSHICSFIHSEGESASTICYGEIKLFVADPIYQSRWQYM